ncbi:hypothetical protein MRB53_008646 [Persea americana]|uniref:Uncharacterized protein n=1 Tax=Persea americana TaxID=3435 RepID=A0ACC2MMQ0_PERAE|nr:hypothetical protein MRB53_008646 [Persea americana]
MVKVLKEMDALPPQATKVAHVTAEVVRKERVEGDGVANKKSVIETQKEITTYWKRLVAPTGGGLHVMVIKDGPILKGGPIMSVVWTAAASIPAVVYSSVGRAAVYLLGKLLFLFGVLYLGLNKIISI